MKLPELYIAVDVEADGPIPGPYSMLSFGMSVVGNPDLTFYIELKPISDQWVEVALKVAGLDRDKLRLTGTDPVIAMQQASQWIDTLRKKGRPVFLAAPAVWDGMFIHWYFLRFLGHSPFGPTGSGIDLRSYWMGIQNCEWAQTRKAEIKSLLHLEHLPHTHHAGEDAKELAKIFEEVLKYRKSF